MDASTLLWDQWSEQVKQLWIGWHGHQKKTLALLVQGIVLAGSAVLPRIAEALGEKGISTVKLPSIERRLARFLANERIQVAAFWQTFLAQVLPYWRDKPMCFVLDSTPFRADATIVYLGLLVHSRVLPVAWAVMPATTKWTESQWTIVARLLDQVVAQVGQAECTLLADRGLVGFPLVHLCRERHWHYLLRLCKEHTWRRQRGHHWSEWSRCGTLLQHAGASWYGRAQVWQEQTIDTSLSAWWQPGYQEGWLLISDQPAGRARVQEYARRIRVEATFQDSKSRGWDLEASWVRDAARLDRLLLALFVAIWWVTHLAASCLHHGQRDRFDRADRRDKSLFRLGRLWLLDILRRLPASPWAKATLTHCLPFRKRATGWAFALRF